MLILYCGEGGIRTLEALASLVVFKTTALVHYATSPILLTYSSWPPSSFSARGGFNSTILQKLIAFALWRVSLNKTTALVHYATSPDK